MSLAYLLIAERAHTLDDFEHTFAHIDREQDGTSGARCIKYDINGALRYITENQTLLWGIYVDRRCPS